MANRQKVCAFQELSTPRTIPRLRPLNYGFNVNNHIIDDQPERQPSGQYIRSVSGKPGFDSRPSQTKDCKLVQLKLPCQMLTKRVVQGKNGLTRCQNNVTERDIIRPCLRCGILVRQHYKGGYYTLRYKLASS